MAVNPPSEVGMLPVMLSRGTCKLVTIEFVLHAIPDHGVHMEVVGEPLEQLH
jgi:hypothetical protein